MGHRGHRPLRAGRVVRPFTAQKETAAAVSFYSAILPHHGGDFAQQGGLTAINRLIALVLRQ